MSEGGDITGTLPGASVGGCALQVYAGKCKGILGLLENFCANLGAAFHISMLKYILL